MLAVKSSDRMDAARPPRLQMSPSRQEQKVGSPSPDYLHLASGARKAKQEPVEPIDPELQLKCVGWSEIRCRPALPERRSYHTLNVVDNILIVYGGFDISEGDRGSMHILDLCAQEPLWTRVELKDVPAALCRHTAVIYNKQLWVLGGERCYEPVGAFFAIHLETFEVRNYYPKKKKTRHGLSPGPPPAGLQPPVLLDSHSAVVAESEQGTVMLVFGGYHHSVCTNEVFLYSFLKDEWQKPEVRGPRPNARAAHSAVYAGGCMYIFGGIDSDSSKLNDLWKLEVDKMQWTKIVIGKGVCPPPRSGHGAVAGKSHLFIFGGIHGMTHEMNDLWAFNLTTQAWSEVHGPIDTWKLHAPLRNEAQEQSTQNLSQMHQSHSTLGLKPGHTRGRTLGYYDSGTGTLSKFGEASSPKKLHSRSVEPSSSIIQKSKIFKKVGKRTGGATFIDLTYLINAVVDTKQVEQALASPTSLLLKNSLLFRSSELGLHGSEGGGGGRRKGRGFQLYQGPKQPDIGLIEGFPPCPRDGVSLAINPATQCFYVFGGDRHQMAYNDLYEFDIGARSLE